MHFNTLAAWKERSWLVLVKIGRRQLICGGLTIRLHVLKRKAATSEAQENANQMYNNADNPRPIQNAPFYTPKFHKGSIVTPAVGLRTAVRLDLSRFVCQKLFVKGFLVAHTFLPCMRT